MLHAEFLAQKFHLSLGPSFAIPAIIPEAVVHRVLSVILPPTTSGTAMAFHRVAPSATISVHLAQLEPCRPSRMRTH